MAEVIFDAFNPNDACLQPPPRRANLPDSCRIEAKFHIRGDSTPKNASLTFRRERDGYVLETAGNEISSGLVRGLGLNETQPTLQSALFYSVALHDWIKINHNNLRPALRAQFPEFIALFSKLRNFVITGSLEEIDPRQNQDNTQLLTEMFRLFPRGLKFVTKALEGLKTSSKSLIVPTMRPRIEWLSDLIKVHQRYQAPFSSFPEMAPIREEMKTWYQNLLIYLGTGKGDLEIFKNQLDALVVRSIDSFKTPIYFEDLYVHFYKQLEVLKNSPFFLKGPGNARLKPIMDSLLQSFEDRRAELIFLGKNKGQGQEVFSKSLLVRLIQTARQGDLSKLVQEDLEKSKLNKEWLRNRETVSEIGGAIISSIRYNPAGGGVGRVAVDVEVLRKNIGQLLKTHSIRRREYLIGSLAVLRFFFGKDFEATSLSAWVQGKFNQVSIELSPETKREFDYFLQMMEKTVWRSSRRSETVLPWIEGGIAVLGAGLIGAGVGTQQRNLTVSGSSVAGLGAGSLLTHFTTHFFLKNRSHNHYLLDPLGGLVGAGAGFGLSFALIRPGAKPITPPPPPPPPPPDPGRRNPTDPHGP